MLLWSLFGLVSLLATQPFVTAVDLQASLGELDAEVNGIVQTLKYGAPAITKQKRVPLSTNDPTRTPLIDLQVYQPPIVPRGGTSCTIRLLTYDFGNTYNSPAVVSYAPPTQKACGQTGKWAAVSMNLTVYSNGTQYDRLNALYLSHVEIWRHSSAEPTKTGTIWTTVKDVTKYSSILSKPGDLLMDFGNIISLDLGLDGVFHVTLEATYHAPTSSFGTPNTPDVIIPLSNGSPSIGNFFTITDSYGGAGTTNVTIPQNAAEAYIEIYASGNSNEEFSYTNTPDEFLPYFPESSGLVGKGPFREVQVLIDGTLAGVVWPFDVIYTGGVTPSNWRPLASYGAYNQPTYYIDITPFLPVLTDSMAHNITLTVFGQGVSPPHSINSNWLVSGNVQLTLSHSKSRTLGKITKYSVAPFASTKTSGSANAGNLTVSTLVTGTRSLLIESELRVDGKTTKVRFEQALDYENVSKYESGGLVQWLRQSTKGVTQSSHGGRTQLKDIFSYPLSLFSNYTLYSEEFGGYGSAINQTFSRTLQLSSTTSLTIHSDQKAQGWIGMDNAPGLRHAINGTGETSQIFGFVEKSETYYRKIHAKNDGWVSDDVWGTLRSGNPAIPASLLDGPKGGPGF